MKSLCAGLALSMLSAHAVADEFVTCENANVTVSSADKATLALICDAASKAENIFRQCNVPSLSGHVRVNVVANLWEGCVALYHCGTGHIEVLSPSLMDKRREEKGAFSFLPAERYFHSVMVHELTHAAFDAVPCPFPSCVVGNEYVAYSVQIMSLSPQERQNFVEQSDLNRKVLRDELSAMLLYIAPHLFAQKAWAHLSQRDDPCGYIGQISDGTIMMDFDRFE